MVYINDVHILYYLLISIIGLIIGKFVAWCNIRLPENEKIFSKEIFLKSENKKTNYLLMIVMAIIYIGILYRFGIKEIFIQNLDLIKYLILAPMLISAFMIDMKLQIIPNRLVLTIFEIGLLISFIYGIVNVNIAIDMFLGMIAGGGIFLIITLLGGFIYGKEAMGFGDVKLMGALGLYFGLYNIIAISVLSFTIAAICIVVFLITKMKNVNDYMPFGPFIVLASGIVTFIPFNIIVFVLLKIFTLGMYKGSL